MLRVLTIALLVALVPATGAWAADVSVVRDEAAGAGDDALDGVTYVVQFTASPGEANDVDFELPAGATTAANEIAVTDAGASLRPGAGCRLAGAGVTCSASDGSLTAVRASLGDRDDRMVSRVTVEADGGAGDDDLRILSRGGKLDGGPGADVFEATAGVPVVVSYASRTAAVQITLDGQADDGEPGEHDRVAATVAGVIGGAGNDVLSAVGATPPAAPQIQGGVLMLDGGAGNDQLFGSSGSDRLTGGAGNDLLAGGKGADELDGGTGADAIRGGSGLDQAGYETRTAPVTVTLDGVANDGEAGEGDTIGRDVEQVAGGQGDDVLVGSGGADQLDGGAGDDRLGGGGGVDVLDGGVGTDTIDPGAGRDRVFASGPDRLLLRDGERDRVSCSTLLSGHVERDGRDRFTGCAPLPTVTRTTLQADRDARVGVPLRCRRGGLPCEGVISLLIPRRRGHGGTPMGRTRFRIEAGHTSRARIRIKGRSRATLLGGRRVTADVRITVGAIETSAKRPLRLLPPR